MIGSIDRNHKHTTVIGGGVAGLLAAYQLLRFGQEVTVLEGAKRVGGLIQTTPTPHGIAESAAHSLLATPAVLELFRDLELEWVPVRPEARGRRYIARGGRIRRLPLYPHEIAPTLARLAFMRAPAEEAEGEWNLRQWGDRFVGKSAVDYLVDPMVRGIYGVRPEELLVEAAFPRWIVPKGKTALRWLASNRGERSEMVTPRLGMGALIAALEKRLGDRIQLGREVQSLNELTGNVILATPAAAAAKLLREVSPEASAALSTVRYVPLVAVTTFMARSQFKSPPRGVGFLVPGSESSAVLGALWNSSSFEGRVRDEDEMMSVTVMMGGSSQPYWAEASDDEIHEAVDHELTRWIGLRGEPVHREIRRKGAIPVYDRNLQQAWRAVGATWGSTPGRVLFGNYTGQVSLRGMIETSRRLAE